MRSAPPGPGLSRVLFISAFLIATCGLIYELVAGAISSYLLGDSVTWFSLVIGAYLSSMGLGSYLSRYIERNLVARFVEALPYRLTGGQERVWLEIRRDLDESTPMNRLLQGDVGSGKTVVAALACLAAIEGGQQAAYLAPTEILAEQQMQSLQR